MKIYRENPVVLGETLDIFASNKKIAKLRVLRVDNISGDIQDVECELIQCDPEYTQSLKVFNNKNGNIGVKIELNK